MKRKEETVVEEVVEEIAEESTTKKEQISEKEVIENTEVSVVNNTLVDKDGFAISENSKVENESEKSPLFIEIDSMRQNYLKSAKLIKYLSYGLMLPIMIGALVALFFLTGETIEDWLKWTLIGIIIALFAGLLVFKILTKRYLDSKASDYVTKYYQTTTAYMIQGEGFSDLVVNPKGKVEKEFFINAGIYENLKSVGSRNLVTFKHNEREFTFVDLAASVQGVKKLEPIFVGKVLKYTSQKEFNGKMLGQIMGTNKLSKPIDGFAGLEQIHKTSNCIFYSNMHKEKNLLTKSVTDLFGKFRLNNDLLDVVISVNKKEIVVGLDYNDPVMQLPVDKKFNKQQIDDIQEALFNSISIIEAIADKLEK